MNFFEDGWIIIQHMLRHTRYQGAILRDQSILLIRHREHQSGRAYWVLPGGGIEPGESEEDCVRREMKEETGLDVIIEQLLIQDKELGGVYQVRKTYLCTAAGEPAPGYEPEEEAAAHYSIDQIGWFDLRQPHTWGDLIIQDPFTYPQLLAIRKALGFDSTG